MAATIEDLKQKNADLVVLLVGGIRTASMLAALTDAGLTPPIFVTARLETILEGGMPEYPGDIFQLAWDDLPDVFSDRVRQRVVRNGLDRWVFEGAKVPEAPGWAKGECKLRSEEAPNVFNTRNIRAIARGTQFATWLRWWPTRSKGSIRKPTLQGFVPTCLIGSRPPMLPGVGLLGAVSRTGPSDRPPERPTARLSLLCGLMVLVLPSWRRFSLCGSEMTSIGG